MTKFYYRGDRVRCVDDTKSPMTLGAEYTVKYVRRFPDALILDGIEGQWRLDRFELVVQPDQQLTHKEG